MTTMYLGQYLGLQIRRGSVGLELEVEFNNDVAGFPPVKGWEFHVDPSLRGHALEFTTNGPISIDSLDEQLNLLFTEIHKYNPVKDTPRTSTHVHVNCTKLIPIQIMNGLIFSWLIEESLLNYCAPHRRSSRFCLSLRNAPLMMKNITRLVESFEFSFMADGGQYKYSNIAYHNLSRIGTIEFRGLEGTFDQKRIKEWATLVYNCIHTPAQMFKDPLDMWQQLQKNPDLFESITQNVLQINRKDIDENYWLMYHLFNGIDWPQYNQKWLDYWAKNEPKKKR